MHVDDMSLAEAQEWKGSLSRQLAVERLSPAVEGQLRMDLDDVERRIRESS